MNDIDQLIAESLAGQDIQDPIWEDVPTAGAVGDEPERLEELRQPLLVRTVEGGLDFVTGVAQELEDYTGLDLVTEKPQQAPKKVCIDVNPVGATRIRTTQYSVVSTEDTRILRADKYRRRALIHNAGADDVAISYATHSDTTGIQPNMFPLLPITADNGRAPLEVFTIDEVWCRSTESGTALVYVLEEIYEQG